MILRVNRTRIQVDLRRTTSPIVQIERELTLSGTKSLDKDRLSKLLAHLDNDNENERLNAWRLTKKTLEGSGYKFSDLPAIFGGERLEDRFRPWTTPQYTDRQRQADADAFRRRAEAEKAAREASERREAAFREQRKQAARKRLKSARAAVIAKYGSLEAACRATGLERSVSVAFDLAQREQQQDRVRNGRYDKHFELQNEKNLIAAIRRPGPFPTSIAAAHAEVQYWRQRVEELRLLAYNEGGWDVLSSGCALRQKMVQDAFRSGFRSTCHAEVRLRQRAVIEGDTNDNEDLEKAILADLEHLAAQARANPPPTEMSSVPPAHLVTPTARRKEAIRIMSGPDAGLSDREIARRLGMSNATVSAIRRRLVEERRKETETPSRKPNRSKF
jgi:hypothetical protein